MSESNVLVNLKAKVFYEPLRSGLKTKKELTTLFFIFKSTTHIILENMSPFDCHSCTIIR